MYIWFWIAVSWIFVLHVNIENTFNIYKNVVKTLIDLMPFQVAITTTGVHLISAHGKCGLNAWARGAVARWPHERWSSMLIYVPV
jgi:hypothetical protein